MERQRPASVGKLPHILIVEDNPDVRDSLCMLLQLLGYQVEVAANGGEGIRKALASRPEVGVIDIGLPGVDGYEVARRLRAALGSSIRLIAHTAYTQPENRERALQAGFNVFLGKPAEPERLTDLLNWA